MSYIAFLFTWVAIGFFGILIDVDSIHTVTAVVCSQIWAASSFLSNEIKGTKK